MPRILRSSAVGKLRLGRTTTVPSPRSSGSLAGYRTAKVRCSSSKGTIGGADHIAKDNQSFGVRASPEFSESSFSARSLGGGRPRGRHGGIIEGMTQSITFYDAVGGEPTFRRLVADFYRRVATDPVLRMRHHPFAIGPAERDAWLRHMTAAVQDLELPPELAAPLLEYVTMAARALVNRPGQPSS